MDAKQDADKFKGQNPQELITSFLRSFATMQKSTLDVLTQTPDKINSLKDMLDKVEGKNDEEALKLIQYVAVSAIKGLEGCYAEYQTYKDKWLPAVGNVRQIIDSAPDGDPIKSHASDLVDLIHGMEVIINSLLVVSEQYKILAEAADVVHQTAISGERPAERAQQRRGEVDQNEEVKEIESEPATSAPGTPETKEPVSSDVKIACARLASAQEECHYVSHELRNARRCEQLRAAIADARGHGLTLVQRLSNLLTK